MVGNGWQWLAMVGNGWQWLAMVGSGWRWLAVVGSGWQWLAVVGSGWHIASKPEPWLPPRLEFEALLFSEVLKLLKS